MKDKMIEDALEIYEIKYKPSTPIGNIQVDVPTTTTFIINCAQILLTEISKGSTRDMLMTGYIKIENYTNLNTFNV